MLCAGVGSDDEKEMVDNMDESGDTPMRDMSTSSLSHSTTFLRLSEASRSSLPPRIKPSKREVDDESDEDDEECSPSMRNKMNFHHNNKKNGGFSSLEERMNVHPNKRRRNLPEMFVNFKTSIGPLQNIKLSTARTHLLRAPF